MPRVESPRARAPRHRRRSSRSSVERGRLRAARCAIWGRSPRRGRLPGDLHDRAPADRAAPGWLPRAWVRQISCAGGEQPPALGAPPAGGRRGRPRGGRARHPARRAPSGASGDTHAPEAISEEQRHVFVLYEIGVLTMPEIAEAVYALQTAYSRLHAARRDPGGDEGHRPMTLPPSRFSDDPAAPDLARRSPAAGRRALRGGGSARASLVAADVVAAALLPAGTIPRRPVARVFGGGRARPRWRMTLAIGLAAVGLAGLVGIFAGVLSTRHAPSEAGVWGGRAPSSPGRPRSRTTAASPPVEPILAASSRPPRWRWRRPPTRPRRARRRRSPRRRPTRRPSAPPATAGAPSPREGAPAARGEARARRGSGAGPGSDPGDEGRVPASRPGPRRARIAEARQRLAKRRDLRGFVALSAARTRCAVCGVCLPACAQTLLAAAHRARRPTRACALFTWPRGARVRGPGQRAQVLGGAHHRGQRRAGRGGRTGRLRPCGGASPPLLLFLKAGGVPDASAALPGRASANLGVGSGGGGGGGGGAIAGAADGLAAFHRSWPAG